MLATAAFLVLSQIKPRFDPPSLHLTPDVTASLEKTQTGWEIALTGPASPSNWAADPDSLQISVESVGAKQGTSQPTLQFLNPTEAVAAKTIEGRPETAARVPVQVSLSSPDPSFVRLKSSGYVLGTDSRTQKAVTLPVRVSERRVYVPRDIQPPKVEPGLRFFYLPEKLVPLKDEDGTAIAYEKAMLKELRLESYTEKPEGGFEAKFRLEAWPRVVSLSGTGRLLDMPGLAPILWDDAARQLRIKFLNKPVWIYGGSIGAVTDHPDEWVGLRVGVVQPVRIKKILRLYTRAVPLNIGPQIAAIGGETLSTFLTDCPIYTVVDTGKLGEITSAMGVSTDDMSKRFKRPEGVTGFNIAADEWQFERTFSLKSGVEQHPDWPADIHQAVAAGKPRKGMSHAMIAWTLGWPGEPGQKMDLMKWSKWRYDIVTPYSYWIYFDGDKVVRFGEESRPK